MSEIPDRVIARVSAVTLPSRAIDTKVEVPAKRPGIVIFLHGVNDPGANYVNVEQGLCEGLNWRLDRPDLKAGVYGVEWANAKAAQAAAQKDGKAPSDDIKQVIYDPDSNLYKRTEDTSTNSIFIPFYWGYRASSDEIAKDADGNPILLRGQHQDTRQNRLDAHFAKEGGFADNATNNIPDMYGAGFRRGLAAKGAQKFLDDYTYLGDGPERHYFVLAAHRLAMLIREIRAVNPARGTDDETITVIGHSQGTLIGLLAQAILAEEDQRTADTLILVDSPYTVWDVRGNTQSAQAKFVTLANIVAAVTTARHPQPALSSLAVGQPGYGGRTGRDWSPTQGKRPLGGDGAPVAFAERDNRGKVYLYFCPDDTVVGLDTVQGLGTYGLPDMIEEGTGSVVYTPARWAAMDAFKQAPQRYGFYQRMWTLQQRDGQPVHVGEPPQTLPVRLFSEPQYPGKVVEGYLSQHAYYSYTARGRRPMDLSLDRWINGEAITPPYAPNLRGGETKDAQGRSSGQLPVDAVAVSAALGNASAAKFQWLPLDVPPERMAEVQRQSTTTATSMLRDEYNSQHPDVQDQTDAVRLTGDGHAAERRETPNEAQARLAGKATLANSYHSGILSDPANLRAVAAMDMAIGQAKTLDDPDWRALLLAMADWRTDWSKAPPAVLQRRGRLSEKAQALVEATYKYYYKGDFPSEELVSRTWPSLVKSQTPDERFYGKNDPGAIA